MDKFYDNIRKMESNYTDYKITALVKKANRSKKAFDRHKLYMLPRKLNPKNFDDHINEDKFFTLRLVTDADSRCVNHGFGQVIRF